ncbi:MAG: hypothetical protein HUJ25_00905 [Crocinitomicaceae bacterium]|nr:hypothetical protein [Crocinitomicaceae bacterium]
MDAFLDYIEKYKFALLGTALIHVVFFFYANFATLERPYASIDPEAEILLPLEDVELDPEIMKQLDLNKKESVPQEIANISADANDQRERSYENFSTQELDKQVENEARELEQQFFEEWEATHDNSGENKSSADIETENDKRNNNNTLDRSNIDTEGSNAYAGEVMVSYKLDNRKAHSLPRPGYTCNSSGTVVIDIKVDQAGNIKGASYNSSLSSGATECMIDKALRYAKKSRFNYSGSASGSQSGTITYKFVSR